MREGEVDMRIGFIGAGKVATAFRRFLHAHGLTIGGYFDRHEDKRAHACRMTQSRTCQNAAEVAQVSDMVLITTRDDQIMGVCHDLAEQGVIRNDHLVGHMSGAHASVILQDAARQGAAIFSLHPLQAFAEEEKALSDLPHTYFSIEGTDRRLTAVEEIMTTTGNRFFRILPEHKRLYHLSACIFSNYLVTLMGCGMETLAHSGILPEEGFTAMMPLIQGTIDNIARIGPAKALTGPIARGDVTTVAQHLDALRHESLQTLEEFYAFMGLKTLDLACRDVLNDPAKADALKNVLEGSR